MPFSLSRSAFVCFCLMLPCFAMASEESGRVASDGLRDTFSCVMANLFPSASSIEQQMATTFDTSKPFSITPWAASSYLLCGTPKVVATATEPNTAAQ